jgi:hypothetical protein
MTHLLQRTGIEHFCQYEHGVYLNNQRSIRQIQPTGAYIRANHNLHSLFSV